MLDYEGESFPFVQFEEQQAFEKSRKFLRQLEICFAENPAHHQKIIKVLQSCADCLPQEIAEVTWDPSGPGWVQSQSDRDSWPSTFSLLGLQLKFMESQNDLGWEGP